MGNAIKFTDEGSVRLVVRFVLHDTEPSMQFDIIDTAVGVTSEQIIGLCMPFNQADTSTTRKVGGTGLGLTIPNTSPNGSTTWPPSLPRPRTALDEP